LSLWWQALARLAEEIAKSGIPEGSRKINGKYIQTHLVTRLKGTIMLFIYPNKSTTSIWFACALMDNCTFYEIKLTLMQFPPLLYPY
jgi:transposase